MSQGVNKEATVSISRHLAAGLSVGDLAAALKDILDPMGGIGSFLRGHKSVLIKPNLTAGAPCESGGTTSVVLVEALVQLVLDEGVARVAIGEGAGAECCTDWAYDRLGYTEMAQRLGVELLDLDRYGYTVVPVREALWKSEIMVSRAVMEYESYITVPCLKTHPGCGITVAIKNAFGTLPDRVKTEAHREDKVEEVIVDLLSIRPPDLIVVDGLIGSQGIGGGSDFVHPVGCGLLICGANAVAVDRVCCEIMSQNSRVRHLQWADKKGLGPAGLERIMVKGETIDNARVPFLSPADQLEMDIDRLRIEDSQACTGCRNAVAMSFLRLSAKGLSSPITAVCGPFDLNLLEDNDRTVICIGDCACKQAGEDKGSIKVPGCPVTARDFMGMLHSSRFLCKECEERVREALKKAPTFPGRILTCGQVISDSEGSVSSVLVGDCMEGYYQMNANRSAKSSKLGTGLARDAALVKGCPPTIEAILEMMNQA